MSRKKFAQEVGFLPPPVHVRDNLELKPSGYRITLRGVIVGEGEVFPGMFLAIDPSGIATPLIGTPRPTPRLACPRTGSTKAEGKTHKWPVYRG